MSTSSPSNTPRPRHGFALADRLQAATPILGNVDRPPRRAVDQHMDKFALRGRLCAAVGEHADAVADARSAEFSDREPDLDVRGNSSGAKKEQRVSATSAIGSPF